MGVEYLMPTGCGPLTVPVALIRTGPFAELQSWEVGDSTDSGGG